MSLVPPLTEMRHVRTEIRDRIATITLDRAPVNALDSVAIRELTATFNALARSTQASVIVFTAAGEKLFCGGIDLHDSARRHARQLVEDDTTLDLLDPGAVVRELFVAIYDCPLPVIAAINGKCIGVGVLMAASCDMLLASDNASFAVPEIKVGVLGGARHLQRLVGPFKTRRMFFTGETVPAEEFYRLGAVEAVVPPGDLLQAAHDLAAQIARNNPIGLRLGKESLSRVEELSLRDGYRIEQDYTGRVTRYNDSQEARTAFMEKREPQWTWT